MEMLLRAAPATFAILAITVVVSFVALKNAPKLLPRMVLHPWALPRTHRYETLITHGFVHGSPAHLLFNMVTLYSFGPPLEMRLGTPTFLALYFLGMLASALGTILTHRKDPQYSALGASGAILAVLFAFIVYEPTSVLLLFFVIPMPATVFAVAFLAYTIWAGKYWRRGTAHEGHFGGAIFGMLFVTVIAPGQWHDVWLKVSEFF
jgi:membrane associated rhomboid family serine protease